MPLTMNLPRIYHNVAIYVKPSPCAWLDFDYVWGDIVYALNTAETFLSGWEVYSSCT